MWECFYSEIDEFKEALEENDFAHAEEEFGDILFASVNLARWNKIDAEQALLKANRKFIARFRKMEELATKPLEEYSFEETLNDEQFGDFLPTGIIKVMNYRNMFKFIMVKF